jgi:hypothetical protein
LQSKSWKQNVDAYAAAKAQKYPRVGIRSAHFFERLNRQSSQGTLSFLKIDLFLAFFADLSTLGD